MKRADLNRTPCRVSSYRLFSMKKLLCLLASLLAFTITTVVCGGEPSPAPLKVLFVGNSYTYVNDLPSMVVAMAEAAGGRKVEAERHLVGGCTFERHVKETGALDKIQESKWDVVVLQEQSLRPIVERAKMREYASLLHAEATKQGAEIVFYLTWARQHIPDMQEGSNPATSVEYAQAM